MDQVATQRCTAGMRHQLELLLQAEETLRRRNDPLCFVSIGRIEDRLQDAIRLCQLFMGPEWPRRN